MEWFERFRVLGLSGSSEGVFLCFVQSVQFHRNASCRFRLPTPWELFSFRLCVLLVFKSCFQVFSYFRSNFTPFFGRFFPNFGGRTGEGNLQIFPHFSGIAAPEAFWAL